MDTQPHIPISESRVWLLRQHLGRGGLTQAVASTWWILRAIASACFESADTIPSNAGDDRQAPLGPFNGATSSFLHGVSPSLSCRQFCIYVP